MLKKMTLIATCLLATSAAMTMQNQQPAQEIATNKYWLATKGAVKASLGFSALYAAKSIAPIAVECVRQGEIICPEPKKIGAYNIPDNKECRSITYLGVGVFLPMSTVAGFYGYKLFKSGCNDMANAINRR